MTDATHPDYARLDRAIEGRAAELGLTFVQLAERAGISDVLLRNLRKGRGNLPRPVNIRRLENALGWAPGSLVAVLEGSDPVLAAAEPAVKEGKTVEELVQLIADTEDELRWLNPKNESNRPSLEAHFERRLADLRERLKALQASS